MSEQLRKDIRDEIAEGRVVVVVGAGVSIAATKGASVASWDGLLKDGVRYCREVAGAPEQWANLRLAQIKTGETEELITAAELITTRLGGREGGEYARWLKESIGSLSIKDAVLLKAIGDVGAPIVTTNYDNLLEQATGLPYVTWKEPRKIDDFIRDKRQAVVHIHGHWDEPESVVLGVRSYEDILGDEAAQNALRALLSTRTLLFVGVGVAGGLSDPNFGALREWIAGVHRTSTHRHYVLVKDDEVGAARSLLRLEGRILPLGYGPQHSDLARFLQTLVSVQPPPTPPPAPSVALPDLTAHEQIYRRRLKGRYAEDAAYYVPLSGETTEAMARPVEPQTPRSARRRQIRAPAEYHEWMQSGQEIKRVKLANLQEGVGKYPCLILLGDPGSGKTTALENLAYQFADQLDQLPLPLRLSEFAPEMSVEDFIVQGWSGSLDANHWGCPELAANLAGYLKAGKLFFLFDALNEMPREGYKERTRALRHFIEQWHPKGNRFLVTCRVLDYGEELSGLQRVEVQPLNNYQILQFLQRELPENWQGLWEALTERGDDNRRLLKMARNPYQLTMMIDVFNEDGHLYQNRAGLMTRLTHILMDWEKRKCPPDEWLDADIQREALSVMAFEMQKRAGSGAVVKMPLVKTVMPQQVQLAPNWPPVASPPDQVLRLAASANIIEMSVDFTSVRFYHQLLQEYFAAHQMLKRDPAGLYDLWRWPWLASEMPKWERPDRSLGPLPPPPQTGWEETTILAAGLAVKNDDRLVRALVDVNPVLAGLCLHEGRAKVSRETRQAAIDALLSTIAQPEIALRVRIAAGEVLGFLGDPRIPDPRDLKAMIHIPAGEFLMGENPQRRIYLDEYWIDKYPVTNSQYRRFIEVTGHPRKPSYWNHPRFNKPNQPVVGVSWYDAMAYCEWAGKRLPTEAEWEKAARGTDGRTYPWGDEPPDHRRANYDVYVGKTTPVGLYPSGVSPYGAMDMAGGVWEWCLDEYQDDFYDQMKERNPFAKGDIIPICVSKSKRVTKLPKSLRLRKFIKLLYRMQIRITKVINNFTTVGTNRVLRGGSWNYIPYNLRVASRDRYYPVIRVNDIGFRCACPRLPC
ncbi:SUMF1/EgtB/PvdO family nonheme iron enzyme [Candidatus Poribacteria bacterium]|nr:SUMF1/EgtB/PvdO family nonheme iron enzyme [Candidatus Poribacteria bacterium]